MKSIYLIRHTRPQMATGTCYGQTDLLPEKTAFQEQLNILLEQLKNIPIGDLYSSPLKRCTQLAQALRPECTLQTDPRLMEMHFGQWEMLNWDQIPEQEMTSWSANYLHKNVPGGESFQELKMRVLQWWNEQQIHHNRILVAHAGVIRVILGHLLEIPDHKLFTLDIRFGQLIEIKLRGPEHHIVLFH